MPNNFARIRSRQQIVFGLLEVMSGKGYENASIQLIGKACDLTPGLIHYHFKNKQDILVELTQTLYDIARNRYLTLTENLTSSEEKLEAFIDAALSLGPDSNERAVSAWVIIGAEAIRQSEVRLIYQEIMKQNHSELTSLITEYTKEHDLNVSPLQIQNMVTMSLASIEGAYQLATTTENLAPRDYAAETLKAFLFNTLKTQKIS